MMYQEDTRRSTFDLRRARYFESRAEALRNQRHGDARHHHKEKMPEKPRRASS